MDNIFGGIFILSESSLVAAIFNTAAFCAVCPGLVDYCVVIIIIQFVKERYFVIKQGKCIFLM